MRARLVRRPLAVLVLTLFAGVGWGCSKDAEGNGETKPGKVGGVCNFGTCDEGICYQEEVCIDPDDPCRGFDCGGNGTCFVDLDTEPQSPVCMCDEGFSNVQYSLLCQEIFLCFDRTELSLEVLCDGVPDCAEGEDELNC